MVVHVLENLRVMVSKDLIPVAQKDLSLHLAIKLTQDRLEVVPAVAVQQHDLPDVAPDQGPDKVFDHQVQCRRVQVHGERKTGQVGFRAVGDGRQKDDAGPPFGRRSADLIPHDRPFEHVGAIGEVEIVGFGGPEREDGHFVRGLLDVTVVELEQLERHERRFLR